MYKKGMLHKESFQNKVILITGGGSGLGKSIGKYLLELGASIIITSRKMEVLQKTTDEFNKDFPDKTFIFQFINTFKSNFFKHFQFSF